MECRNSWDCAAAVVSLSPKEVVAKAQQDFAAYVDLRKADKNRKLAPPVDPIRPGVTLHQIFYGFTFWWVPGNEWHSLMMKDQARLGFYMQIDSKNEGIAVPGFGQKPQLEVPFEVPDSWDAVLGDGKIENRE